MVSVCNSRDRAPPRGNSSKLTHVVKYSCVKIYFEIESILELIPHKTLLYLVWNTSFYDAMIKIILPFFFASEWKGFLVTSAVFLHLVEKTLFSEV